MVKLIPKNIYGNLCVAFNEHENWALVDYANRARKALESDRKDEGRGNFENGRRHL
jgi:hypothetical protein